MCRTLRMLGLMAFFAVVSQGAAQEIEPAAAKPDEPAAAKPDEPGAQERAKVNLVQRKEPDLDFQQPNQGMNTFIDGEYMTVDVNGNQRVTRQDVLQQLRHYQQFKFCRVLPGDTLEKIAVQQKVPAQTIRLLNQIEKGSVFGEESLLCLSWSQTITEDATLEELAKQYKTTADVLARLNSLNKDARAKAGTKLQFPAVYRRQLYEDGRQKMSLFMVIMPQSQPVQRQVLEVQRIETKQYQVREGDTLEDLAKAHEIDVEMLRKINGLNEKSELKTEQILFVRCGVKYDAEKTPLNLVAQRFNTNETSILRLNDIKDKSKIEAEQWLHIPASNMVRQINARIEARKKQQDQVQQGSSRGF